MPSQFDFNKMHGELNSCRATFVSHTSEEYLSHIIDDVKNSNSSNNNDNNYDEKDHLHSLQYFLRCCYPIESSAQEIALGETT